MSENEKDQDEVKEEQISVEPDTVEDAEIIEGTAVESEPVETEEPEVVPAEPEPIETRPANPSRSNLVPTVLGGVIAASIGFGAATYLNIGGGQNDDLRAELLAQIESQSLQIATLDQAVSVLENSATSTDLEAELSAHASQLASSLQKPITALEGQVASLNTSLAALEQRVLDVEKRPMADTISESAVAAYESEMAGLREAISVHKADIEALAAEARAMETSAKEEAIRSEGATWVTEISIALADGSAFATPLDNLASEGISIPSALRSASTEGVVTQAELIDAFPASARSALSSIRSGDSEEGGNSILTFLQNQVGARSIEPKDGDSADAILSRAEADARAGDISGAIEEIHTLPEAGQAAMSAWVILAEERLAVLAAMDALRDTVLDK